MTPSRKSRDFSHGMDRATIEPLYGLFVCFCIFLVIDIFLYNFFCSYCPMYSYSNLATKDDRPNIGYVVFLDDFVKNIGTTSFERLNGTSRRFAWRKTDQHMNVIRHDFHLFDYDVIVICNLLQDGFHFVR